MHTTWGDLKFYFPLRCCFDAFSCLHERLEHKKEKYIRTRITSTSDSRCQYWFSESLATVQSTRCVDDFLIINFSRFTLYMPHVLIRAHFIFFARLFLSFLCFAPHCSAYMLEVLMTLLQPNYSQFLLSSRWWWTASGVNQKRERLNWTKKN